MRGATVLYAGTVLCTAILCASAHASANACEEACAASTAERAAADAACAAQRPQVPQTPVSAGSPVLFYAPSTLEGLGAKLADFRAAAWAALRLGAVPCGAVVGASVQHADSSYERAAGFLGVGVVDAHGPAHASAEARLHARHGASVSAYTIYSSSDEAEACGAALALAASLQNLTDETLLSHAAHGVHLPPTGAAVWALPPAGRERWHTYGGAAEALRCLRPWLRERHERARMILGHDEQHEGASVESCAASQQAGACAREGVGAAECGASVSAEPQQESQSMPRLFARVDPQGRFYHSALHIRRGDASVERLAWRRVGDAAHAATALAAAVALGEPGTCVHIFTDAESAQSLTDADGAASTLVERLLGTHARVDESVNASAVSDGAELVARCGVFVWAREDASASDVVKHLALADVVRRQSRARCAYAD